jgi:nicotinate-nucleotide pyrophosphorylase (carboxylating)
MNRTALKSFTHNAKDFLSVSKNDYKQWVFRYTFLELEKDLGLRGDISTDAVVKDGVVTASVTVEEDGVAAGLEEIKYFLVDSDPRFRPRIGALEVEFLKKDGDKVTAGDKVLEIRGEARDILKVERVVLNLIMRMSGVASYTAALVEKVSGMGGEAGEVLLTPTRKTLWGWLDKKAVVLGGGGTHRLNLADAVMLKDNHLASVGGSVATAIKLIAEKTDTDPRFIEVEVESKGQALKAAEVLTSFVEQKKIDVPVCLLLDNMSPDEIKDVVSALKEAGTYEDVLLEASGGINEENLEKYAGTGVDIISMGRLTTAAPSLSYSLHI